MCLFSVRACVREHNPVAVRVVDIPCSLRYSYNTAKRSATSVASKMQQQQINSVQEFVNACLTLTNDEMFELFEYNTAEHVRAEMLDMCGDPDYCEPLRYAMHELGFTDF